MPSTKITALPALTTPSSNAQNTVFVVVDLDTGTPTTKKLSLQNLDLFVDNVGSVAFAQANAAFTQANTANVTANAAFAQANAAFVQANSAFVRANGAYTQANTAFVQANNAYNAANSANTFDFTSIVTSPGFYGDSISVTSINLAANGRVISASNVAITANASFLTGTVLSSNVVSSSLTSVGTLSALTVTANATVGNLTISTGGTITANVVTANTLTVSGNTTVGNLTISTGGTITGDAAAGNVSANAVGYMGMPQNNLTSDYVITLADQGKHLYYNVSTNNIVYIPTNANVAFPVGATIDIISRTSSSANVTITPNTGVSLFLAGNTTSAGRNVTTYGTATLICVEANTWFVRGSGISAL
jgi:hypothetical protein